MIDVTLGRTGDLEVSNSGQPMFCVEGIAILQAIKFNLSGSKVARLLGEPMNRSRSGIVEGKIRQILSTLLPDGMYKIKTVPVSKDSLAIFMTVFTDPAVSLGMEITASQIKFVEG